MFTYHKFFDVDAPEAPAAPINLAAIAAKSGILTTPGNEGVVPSINTSEKKEEPIPATPALPATATEPKLAAQAKPESPTPTTEPAAAKPQTEEPVKVPTWQEVLKSQQPDTIFKELGLDGKVVDLSKKLVGNPKMMAFYEHWEKNNGDIKPYLSALSTDFSKMAPEEVMRHQLREEYPELDAKQLDTLYKIKVTNRYKLDEVNYTEEEVAEGRIELMADVKPIRAALTAKQDQYLIPKPPELKPAEPDNQALQKQQEFEAFQTQLTNDPYIKELTSNKKITIGEGAEAFSFAVDPAKIMNIMLDADAWASKLLIQQDNADGSKTWIPNAKKQALIGAILEDEDGFLREMSKHYKSLGGKAAIDPIENAKPPGAGAPAKAEAESTNPAAAAAKRGRLTRGGE